LTARSSLRRLLLGTRTAAIWCVSDGGGVALPVGTAVLAIDYLLPNARAIVRS
jgi:hypothetical protein